MSPSSSVTRPRLTAPEIARLSGKPERTVRAKLSHVPPDIERGTKRAWALSTLPKELSTPILEQAIQRGCSVESLLAEAGTPFSFPIPMAELADECLEKAVKLQRALMPMIEQRNAGMPIEEFERRGVEEYRRVFGHTISTRHWRRLFKRTIERSRKHENWSDVQLYIAENAWRKEKPAVSEVDPILRPLFITIDRIAPKARKSREHRAALWDHVFLFCREHIDPSANQRKIKRLLLRSLMEQVPFLAQTHDALRINFDRKYSRWIENGQTLAAIDDGRSAPDRPIPYTFTQEEWGFLLTLCSKAENVSLGWLEFLESDYATPETKAAFPHDPSTGPRRVPDWIRSKLTFDVRNQQHSIRASRMPQSHITRDPDALSSGESDQADDKTPDVLWWEETPDGLWCNQGQLIMWIDERSWLIYGFRLRTDPAYTGFTLRNSWADKAKLWGFPKQIHVENGTWRTARVFAGRSKELDPAESEMAIRRLGVRFVHARYARGKLIERVFGSLTDLMQLLPGYAGRNQVIDKFERVQKQKRLVDSGRAHPSEFFLHKSQLVEHLNDIIVKLNHRTKYGEYHKKWIGSKLVYLSPHEAYQEFFGNEPLMFIPKEVEYQIRCNVIETTVNSGLRFTFGKHVFEYKNSAELGRLRLQRVKAWFDPEDPSFITVTDLRSRNPFVVPQEPPCDGTPEAMARAVQSNREFESYNKETSRFLKPMFHKDFMDRMHRHPIVDRTALEISTVTERQRGQITAERRAGQSRQRSVERLADDLRLPSTVLSDRPETKAGLEDMKEAQRMHEKELGKQ